MGRVKRLLQPQSLILLACLALGTHLGIQGGLYAYHQEIGAIDPLEKARRTGVIMSIAYPHIPVAVLLSGAIAILISPPLSNREQTQEIARKQLLRSDLTDAELLQWTKVLEDS